MKKVQVILIIGFLLFICQLNAQNTKNTWEIGVGASVVKFGSSDAAFIGDQHLFQVPRLNLTMPINDRLSLDGALSFNTIDDIGFIENSAKYFSADLSLRYNFDAVITKLYPYVFTGGSLVDSERKMTPTLNVGAGATYWFTEKWGLNSQLFYKHSFEGYESMRSHLQGTFGLVFSFDRLFGRGVGGSGSSPCID